MQHATEKEEDLLLTSQAARECGVSRGTIILWVNTGKLDAIRTTSGVRLFRRAEIERVKREREEKVTA